jgi:hypothetical protein
LAWGRNRLEGWPVGVGNQFGSRGATATVAGSVEVGHGPAAGSVAAALAHAVANVNASAVADANAAGVVHAAAFAVLNLRHGLNLMPAIKVFRVPACASVAARAVAIA